MIRREIVAVALGADPFCGFAGEDGTHVHYPYVKFANVCRHLCRYDSIRRNNDSVGLWVDDVFASNTSINFKVEVSTSSRKFLNAVQGATIFGSNPHILCNIHQLPRQVTRCSGFHRCVHQPFTRTIGRVKIVNNIQPFTIRTEIVRELVVLTLCRCPYRRNEDIAVLFCLQPNKGTDLHKRVFPRTRTTICHDMHRAKPFYGFVV